MNDVKLLPEAKVKMLDEIMSLEEQFKHRSENAAFKKK